MKIVKLLTMNLRTGFTLTLVFLLTRTGWTQSQYPQDYFRHPLDIPMQLVANFGEIRANHWHMGLDIRTQQRVNLPVHAVADGYIARVSVEPGGFGQAIYIDHPNGYTTVYGHLNSFFPALAQYVKAQQYEQRTWKISLTFPPGMFPVKKGDLIALSGSTGASEGPHVHFEIRDTKTEKCLNPLLFHFPIADNVPPTLSRLAVYDRSRSSYDQTPRILALKRSGPGYVLASGTLRTGFKELSFAIGAVDHFTGSSNPNGIYSASVSVDGKELSSFALDNIGYDETRYINAQLDYSYKAKGGPTVQLITPLPGARDVAFHTSENDGVLVLRDEQPHQVIIDVSDANGNTSTLRFTVQYDPALYQPAPAAEGERLLPNNVNVVERDNFELYTTERTIYDTVTVQLTAADAGSADAASPVFHFLSAAIPAHDSFTVRIRPTVEIPVELRDRVVIRNVCGSRTYVQRGVWQNGMIAAKFRQFGSFEALVDRTPPTVNAPPTNLASTSRLVFTPHDNYDAIRSLTLLVDGQWLRCSNDKGHSWIYSFDEKFPRGTHQLQVIVEDEAGNTTTRTFTVTR